MTELFVCNGCGASRPASGVIGMVRRQRDHRYLCLSCFDAVERRQEQGKREAKKHAARLRAAAKNYRDGKIAPFMRS